MLKVKSHGFTLIELMTTVAIVGILASIAIPTFSTYSLKVKDSEAYMLLPELARSLKVYYDQEFCDQGVGATAECETHCLTVWGNSPGPAIGPLSGSGYMPDWDKGAPDMGVFEQINFMPAGPLYHRFSIISSVVSPVLGSLGDQCGNENTASYSIFTTSDLDDDDLAGIRTWAIQAVNGQLVTAPGIVNFNTYTTGTQEW